MSVFIIVNMKTFHEKIDKFFDGTNFITALSNEIIFYSENKKDVETYLKAKKYNI